MESSDYQIDPVQFEMYTKLLLITLWRGGYPHEIVCCMFNKCFDTWEQRIDEDTEPENPVGRVWSPKRIVGELSDVPLEKSSALLEMEYITCSSLPEDLVSDCFRILGRQMQKRVVDLLKPMDRDARKRWPEILDCIVGKTRLDDYFGHHPEDNVSDWTYRVARRVKRAIMQEQWLERPIEQLLDAIVTS